MIKKIRKKLILILSLSLFVVLTIIIFVVNLINFNNVSSSADNILNFLSMNDGEFKTDNQPPKIDDHDNSTNKNDDKHKMDVETPYETRYFYVKENDGTITANVTHVAKIDENKAIEYYEEVSSTSSTRGYLDSYRYYKKEVNFIIFIDCSNELSTAFEFLKDSLIISSIGYVAVFVLVFILSKYAIKPISESYEKQKRFITDASHELKTPLTIISANNELLEMLNGENEANVVINKQIDRMTNMVKNLTSLSRILEVDKLSNSSILSLSDIIIDVSSLFKTNFETMNKKYKEDIEPDLYIKGDENLIRQLFSIIFDNALKYSSSYIIIRAYSENKKIIVKCSNDCQNLKKGNMDRCFERFYRSDDARGSSITGNGIGLSIAKSISDLHSFEISADAIEDDLFEIKIEMNIVNKSLS